MKKQELLVSIIKEYIKDKEPIGSQTLKQRQNLKVSSATIRNYFKILEDDGALFQPHISSGRVPTNTSLLAYWRERLSFLLDSDFSMDISAISSLTSNYEICCIAVPRAANSLEAIINHNNTYIILKFTRGEAVIGFSEAMQRFLESLMGMEIIDIIKVASEVGARELKRKLVALEGVDFEQSSLRYGAESLASLAVQNASSLDRKSTRLNSSHRVTSRMPSSA